MKNSWTIVLTGVLLAASLTYANAQQTFNLSLDEALQKAEKDNYQLNLSKADYEIAKAEHQQTRALFLPNIKIEHTYTSTNDPLASFGFKLQQEIVTANDFNPALLNDPGSIDNFNTQIRVQQPLVNVDGWHQRKAAYHKAEASNFQGKRTKQHVILAIKEAYYGLKLAQARTQFLQKVVKSIAANLKLTQDYYKQGMIKKADVLAMEVRLLEIKSQLKQAELFQSNVNNGLTYLLGMPAGTIIVPTDSLKQQPAIHTAEHPLSNQRPDILAYKNGVQAYANMYKSAKAQYLPTLNAFGVYNFNDNSFPGIDAESWMVGAKLSLNLFDGLNRSAHIKKTKTMYERKELEFDSYLQQQERQLQQAKLSLSASKENLTSAQKAKESAQEAFRIRKDRYKQGMEKTTDLINAETTFANKQLAYLNALYRLNTAVFRLEFLLYK